MADTVHGEELYVFQGTHLLSIEGNDTAPGIRACKREEVPANFSGFASPRADYFEVPSAKGTSRLPCLMLDEETPIPEGWRAVPLRQAVSLLSEAGDPGAAERLFRACHIMRWRRESVFCGVCGSRNGDAPEELARLCPSCGRMEFPRISPAIIVIIINSQDEALLAHNKKFAAGMYSLIAGFNEAGETLESTVAREVQEEVGLQVRDIRYRASQPWPFPNSLMLGFSARHAGGVIKPDGVEIEDAQWFRRDKLPNLPGPGSVSRYLINLWLDSKLES